MADKVEIEIEPDDNSQNEDAANAAEAHAERAHDAEEHVESAVGDAETAANESGEAAQEADAAANAATQAAVDAITSNAETQYTNAQLMERLDSMPDAIAAAIVAANSVSTETPAAPVVEEPVGPDEAPTPGHFWTRDIREVIGSMFRKG